MKVLVRVLVALTLIVGLAACTSGSSNDEAPTSSAPATSPSAIDIGGTMVWRPDAVKAASASDEQCSNPSNIAAGGSALTITVKKEVTYVDLQLPRQLQDLTGLMVGEDYVVIPRSLLEAHVSTVELGNQFDMRSANDVHACWK